MTHFTSGGFALCDKGSKNVNKFSGSAKLAYYLRTTSEKKKKRFSFLTSTVCFLTEKGTKKKKGFVQEEKSDLMSDYEQHVKQRLFF